jgi:hypothetical protein
MPHQLSVAPGNLLAQAKLRTSNAILGICPNGDPLKGLGLDWKQFFALQLRKLLYKNTGSYVFGSWIYDITTFKLNFGPAPVPTILNWHHPISEAADVTLQNPKDYLKNNTSGYFVWFCFSQDISSVPVGIGSWKEIIIEDTQTTIDINLTFNHSGDPVIFVCCYIYYEPYSIKYIGSQSILQVIT